MAYPADERAAALEIVDAHRSCRKAATILGIHYQTLHRWARERKMNEEAAPPFWRCECECLGTAGVACIKCGSPSPPRKFPPHG